MFLLIINSLIRVTEFLIGLLPLNLPSGGVSFQSTLGSLKLYLDNALSFVYTYLIPFNIVQSIFSLVIVWTSVKVGYWLFIWIIHKLPIGVD